MIPDGGDRRRFDCGPPGHERRRRSDQLKPRCPWCGGSESTVDRTFSHAHPDAPYRRRRRCSHPDCGRTFPTVELLDLACLARDLLHLGLTLEALGIDPRIDAGAALAKRPTEKKEAVHKPHNQGLEAYESAASGGEMIRVAYEKRIRRKTFGFE
jgi:hypothetical protein